MFNMSFIIYTQRYSCETTELVVRNSKEYKSNKKRPFYKVFIFRSNLLLYFLRSSISSCIDLILSLNSWLIFSGIFWIFLKSRASIMEAIPIKMKETPVSVTNENPVNTGLNISNREKIIPPTLARATFPQLLILILFRSNAKPNS